MPSFLRLSQGTLRVSSLVERRRVEMQFLTGAVALGLGFWGWSREMPAADWSGHINNAFRTLQLITLQFPTNFDGKIPWQLQIARLLVPLVAVLASFHVIVGAVTRPLRLALLPRTKGHIIVYGDSKLTESALATLAARDRQIVVVAPSITVARRAHLEGIGLTVVEADPRLATTMRELNLKSAAAFFITGADDLDNLNLAMMTLKAIAGRAAEDPPLALGVMIDREDLANEFDHALDGIARQHLIRYHRLSPDREGVRLELARHAPVFTKADKDLASHVLIVGLSGRFEQVLAQVMVAIQDCATARPLLSFLLNEAEARRLAEWRQARPDLDLVVQCEEIAVGAGRLPLESALIEWRSRCGAPHLVVIMTDDTDAISTALYLRRPENPAGTARAPILVRQGREDRLLSALHDTKTNDRDLTRMVAFGGLIRAESIERVLDRKGDAAAVTLHSRYLASAELSGMGSEAAIKAWDELPENLRNANREAIAHAPVLFAALDLTLAKVGEGQIPHALTPPELEILASIEHRHWMASRIDHGWRYGATRDDARLRHPSLRSYAELSAGEKQKDKNTVNVLVEVLAAQGLALLRNRDSISA